MNLDNLARVYGAETGEYREALSGSLALDALKDLEKRSGLASMTAFAIDWSLVILSLVAVDWISYFLLPVALIVIGSRQRALSNLVHDASHGNLFPNPRMNDVAANLLGAFPMGDSVRSYRASHGAHHRHLGSIEGDPDSQRHLSYGYDDRNPPKGSTLTTMVRLFFDRTAWVDALTGSFLSLTRIEKLQVILWWSFLLATIAAIAGLQFASLFAFAWVLSCATAYHGIRLFAEFLDHTGLSVGTITSFTRNLPHGGLLSRIFHPHHDTYHLIHHLFPSIPHYRLRDAHAALSYVPKYQRAHHCDSYLLGKHSAIRCWSGKCQGGKSW